MGNCSCFDPTAPCTVGCLLWTIRGRRITSWMTIFIVGGNNYYDFTQSAVVWVQQILLQWPLTSFNFICTNIIYGMTMTSLLRLLISCTNQTKPCMERELGISLAHYRSLSQLTYGREGREDAFPFTIYFVLWILMLQHMCQCQCVIVNYIRRPWYGFNCIINKLANK